MDLKCALSVYQERKKEADVVSKEGGTWKKAEEKQYAEQAGMNQDTINNC